MQAAKVVRQLISVHPRADPLLKYKLNAFSLHSNLIGAEVNKVSPEKTKSQFLIKLNQ